jgi:hypothetical protein
MHRPNELVAGDLGDSHSLGLFIYDPDGSEKYEASA